MPTSGGEETQVAAGVEPEFWGYWAVVEKGIYYLDTTQNRRLPSSISRTGK